MLYILLPLVIIIWGIILYKFFTAVNTSHSATENLINPVNRADTSLFKIDTFSISNNYRDPFSQNIVSSPKINKNRIVKTLPEKEVVTNVVVVKWPSIVYSGVIKSKKSLQMLALVKINGESNFITRNTTLMGIELLDVFNDSIRVDYMGQQKTIKKTN